MILIHEMVEELEFVYLDIETSGLNHEKDELLQIAAKHKNKEFNVYILPEKRRIHPLASKHTGITIFKNGKMFAKGQQVLPTSIEDALNQFINFLKNLGNFKIILTAHHGINFDFYFLLRDAYRYEINIALKDNVYGFLDTLETIKKYSKRPLYNLENLANEFIPNFNKIDAHNALNDVKFLEQIVNNMKIPYSTLKENILDFQHYDNIFLTKINKK